MSCFLNLSIIFSTSFLILSLNSSNLTTLYAIPYSPSGFIWENRIYLGKFYLGNYSFDLPQGIYQIRAYLHCGDKLIKKIKYVEIYEPIDIDFDIKDKYLILYLKSGSSGNYTLKFCNKTLNLNLEPYKIKKLYFGFCENNTVEIYKGNLLIYVKKIPIIVKKEDYLTFIIPLIISILSLLLLYKSF